MTTKYEVRYAHHPQDAKHYDTERLRAEFLISKPFEADSVNMVYTMYDRLIVGGAMPVFKTLQLESIDPLRAKYFLERREIGIINVGGNGIVKVDGVDYVLGYKETLYIGKGSVDVWFTSEDSKKPALFYFNSSNAHTTYPTRKITLADANVLNLGSVETANERTVNQLIVNQRVDTCQLQMGMTELKRGSVWNTIPAHVHNRRMEAYFYFEVPENQSVCHFMGETNETRHIWMQNNQAIISPTWSIHSAAGTSNYVFIWGMAGENLDYGDMDVCQTIDLK